jgi:hypothetical protein
MSGQFEPGDDGDGRLRLEEKNDPNTVIADLLH